MKKYCCWLLLVTALVCSFASCQKEISQEGGFDPNDPPIPSDTIPGNNTEVGNWKFMQLQGNLSQTAEFSQAGIAAKAVTKTGFTSLNNGGTINFDGAKMTATDITFSIDVIAKTYIYVSGILLDSVESPLKQTVPAQTATSEYNKIGSDSLHFKDAAFLDALTGGLIPSPPSGCKLQFEGANSMKMKIVYDTVVSQDYQGVPAKITLHTEFVATLQKNP